MPAGSTPEREQLMRLFGADVVYSPAELGSNGAVTMARELAAADPTLYMPFQYGNAANPRAHERGTAEEILAACPEVDVFVAGLGTGGTLMGCARRLRRDRPDLQVVAAEPLPGEGIDGPALARGRLHARDPRPLAARPQAARQQRGLRARPARPGA